MVEDWSFFVLRKSTNNNSVKFDKSVVKCQFITSRAFHGKTIYEAVE